MSIDSLSISTFVVQSEYDTREDVNRRNTSSASASTSSVPWRTRRFGDLRSRPSVSTATRGPVSYSKKVAVSSTT